MGEAYVSPRWSGMLATARGRRKNDDGPRRQLGRNLRLSSLAPAGAVRARSKRREQLPRDGAGRSATDAAVVDLDDRDELLRRAGEKGFIGSEQVVLPERLIACVDAEVARDLDDEFARDAGQQPGVERWRQHRAALHDEEIRLAAFG